ncbi:MAG: hypothetical protein AAF960_05435 [Bacteroidota bacterium]
MENIDTEKIEQYLAGQLNVPEQESIVARMKAEPAFAEAVNLHHLTMMGIERFGLNEVRKDIRQLDSAMEKEGFFLSSEDMDGYLAGTLSNDQRAIMEQRLAKDTAFKADFELHELTQAGIEKEGNKAALADLFKDLDKDLAEEGFFDQLDAGKVATNKTVEEPTAKIIRFPFRRLAIAASIALAVATSWWVFRPTAPTPEMIYTNYFSPLSDELSEELAETGFVTEPYYDLLEEAMTAYNTAQNRGTDQSASYQQAKTLFVQYRQSAPPTDDFYPTATLYLAITHLNLEEVTSAINLLTPLQNQNFPQQTAAQWYLALAYLKDQQTEKAIPLLSSLSQSTYKEQAQTILKTLE